MSSGGQDPRVRQAIAALGYALGPEVLEASSRLFRDEQQALALYQDRLPAYRMADVTLDIGNGEQPQEVASRIELLLGGRK